MVTDYFEGQEEVLAFGEELKKIKEEMTKIIAERLDLIVNQVGDGDSVKDQISELDIRLQQLGERKDQILNRIKEIGFRHVEIYNFLSKFDGPKN